MVRVRINPNERSRRFGVPCYGEVVRGRVREELAMPLTSERQKRRESGRREAARSILLSTTTQMVS